MTHPEIFFPSHLMHGQHVSYRTENESLTSDRSHGSWVPFGNDDLYLQGGLRPNDLTLSFVPY